MLFVSSLLLLLCALLCFRVFELIFSIFLFFILFSKFFGFSCSFSLLSLLFVFFLFVHQEIVSGRNLFLMLSTGKFVDSRTEIDGISSESDVHHFEEFVHS
jgi:hypothetical protein